jgi:hypothetical protein
MEIQEIINLCKTRVSIDEVLIANTHTICLDGTSATKKSSILNATGKKITKIQKIFNVINADTYFPSNIGYIAAGIVSQNQGEPHFNDRSFLNVLEWNILWKIINEYAWYMGNTNPENNADAKPLIEKYIRIFESLKESYFYKIMRSQINALAFIDSDVRRCDEVRMQRNTGSDLQRSRWKFYTYLQNLMYVTLYPNSYIDMAWFGNSDINNVRTGIACWLNELLAEAEKRFPRKNIIVPMRQFKLPDIKHDYTLGNFTTHVYRSMGRVKCKQLSMHNNNDDDNDCENMKTTNVSLSDYVPACLNVFSGVRRFESISDAFINYKRDGDNTIVSMDEMLVNNNSQISQQFVDFNDNRHDDDDHGKINENNDDDDGIKFSSFVTAFENDNE